MQTLRPLSFVLLAATLILNAGCKSETTEASGISASVTELAELATKIKDGLEAGTEEGGEMAHEALHPIQDVLKKLAAVSSDSGLNAEDRDKVKSAAESVAAAFSAIDGDIHDGKEVNYADHADAIKEGMATLESFGK